MSSPTPSMTKAIGKMIPTSDGSELLLSDLPFVVKTQEQYDDALAISERLFFKQNRTELEEQILDVWFLLIELYEQETFEPGGSATPTSILSTLMEAREFTQADLVREGIGSRGVVSEMVNGKRAISKEQAKKLAEVFNVSPALFI